MKRQFWNILITACFIIPVLFVSCKKSKETKLVGEWEIIQLAGDDYTYNTIWNFADGDELIVNKMDSAGFIADSDTAIYELRSRSFKYYVIIDSLSKYEDGFYHIEKLKKDILILQCKDPFIRREMVKK